MITRLLFFLLTFVGGMGVTYAQTTPQWMHKPPKARNASYVFIPVTVDAASLKTGRHESLKMLALDRGLLSTLEMCYQGTSQSDSHSVEHAGHFSERIETHTIDVTKFNGRPVQVTACIVDEYLRKGRMTTLYQVGVTPNPTFDQTIVTTRYGARGLWRSMIIPGWGQFHKGANLKGGLILGGCAALAAGIVFTENQRSDYMSKIRRTHNAILIRNYTTKANHMATARNICIGTAAALYVYNLIDAIASPGARRAIVKKTRKAGSATYSFAPGIQADGAAVIAASVIF